MVVVHGDVSPAYEAVRDAFAENFRSRGEVGAAVAVVIDSQVVVDLWGGSANPRQGRPWQRDTLVNLFSTTTGPVCARRRPRSLGGCSSTTSRWPRTGRSSPPTGAPCHRTYAAVAPGGAVRDRRTDDGGDAGRPWRRRRRDRPSEARVDAG